MTTSQERRSPVHRLLQTSSVDREVLRDLSTRPKLGVKGPGAGEWLRGQGIDLPPATYDTRSLADGGLIARLGAADFFLEGGGQETGSQGDIVSSLLVSLSSSTGESQIYRVERHDAGFLLKGPAPWKCLLNFAASTSARPQRRLILTRAGGMNCTVLPDFLGEVPTFRLWVDYTFGVAFWESLVQIIRELGLGGQQTIS